MSTNLIVSILVGLAVVGAGAYVVINPDILGGGAGGPAAVEEGMMENEEGGASVGQTFAQLLGMGQDLECTFAHADEAGNKSSGTVYISNGGEQLAGDFMLEQTGQEPMEGHMIRTGDYNYIWGSFYDQGIKTAVTEENETELFPEDSEGTLDPNTEFNCQAWTVNSAKFNVPSNIQFMDVSAQMEAMMEASGSADIQAQQCAACEQLPDGAKEQCLAALSC